MTFDAAKFIKDFKPSDEDDDAWINPRMWTMQMTQSAYDQGCTDMRDAASKVAYAHENFTVINSDGDEMSCDTQCNSPCYRIIGDNIKAISIEKEQP